MLLPAPCAFYTAHGLDQSELAKLAKVHPTTIIRLEAFDAHSVRGQSGTIMAVVNALAKAGVDLGENGSVIPGRKGARVPVPYIMSAAEKKLLAKS